MIHVFCHLNFFRSNSVVVWPPKFCLSNIVIQFEFFSGHVSTETRLVKLELVFFLICLTFFVSFVILSKSPTTLVKVLSYSLHIIVTKIFLCFSLSLSLTHTHIHTQTYILYLSRLSSSLPLSLSFILSFSLPLSLTFSQFFSLSLPKTHTHAHISTYTPTYTNSYAEAY